MSMVGLTDNQQAAITFISMSLIAIGAASVPAGAPWYAVLIIEMCGALGMALKEFLGTALVSTSANNQPSANAGNGAASSSASLPPLPSGFSLEAVKATGAVVYENAAGNIVIGSPNTNSAGKAITTWSDADGNIYPAMPDLTGYTLL